MSTETLEAAAEIAEGLKSETTFNARAAVTGATYPQDSIDVYSDAKLAHELNLAANEAAKARYLAESIKAGWVKKQTLAHSFDTSVEAEDYKGDGTEAPDYAKADAEATELEAKVAELVKSLQGTVLTFHIRGLAPAQWRLIHKKWRKEIKPPARKNFPMTEDGEEEYELAVHERNIERNDGVNLDTIASAITKVVRKRDGAENSDAWKVDDVRNIFDYYLESEFDKIKNLVQQLTFANNLFQIAVEKDADFLSKP
jgi:hypothetical protein